MTRFGIQDYQPRWRNGRKDITEAHGQSLAALVGHTLHHVWLVWDLDADEWFTDAPVHRHDMANFSIAIGLDLAPAWLTIFNAMDENGLEHRPPGPNYRRHRL